MEKEKNKDTIWGWFWKYHEITNSKWFSESSDLDKKSVLIALDSDYPVSTARIKATLTTTYTIIIYAIASTFWGFALKGNTLLFALGGAVLGLPISVMSALVITKQRTIERADDMQFAASAIWHTIGFVIGAVGLIVWAIRVIFFH